MLFVFCDTVALLALTGDKARCWLALPARPQCPDRPGGGKEYPEHSVITSAHSSLGCSAGNVLGGQALLVYPGLFRLTVIRTGLSACTTLTTYTSYFHPVEAIQPLDIRPCMTYFGL